MTHAELIERGKKWLRVTRYPYRSAIILTEFVTYANSIPDVFGMNHYQSTVIECKASLADFYADLRKHHRHYRKNIGNYRFYLCPVGLIPVDKIPDGWGLLYCHPKKITIEKEPISCDALEVRAEEHYILYSIVLRAQVDGLLPQILRTAEQRKLAKLEAQNE